MYYLVSTTLGHNSFIVIQSGKYGFLISKNTSFGLISYSSIIIWFHCKIGEMIFEKHSNPEWYLFTLAKVDMAKTYFVQCNVGTYLQMQKKLQCLSLKAGLSGSLYFLMFCFPSVLIFFKTKLKVFLE